MNGKVAIVTGAARGMGASHARRLVAEGARVVLTDILTEEGGQLSRSLGERALFLPQDVTSKSDWQRVLSETERHFGPVSVLVNNAGTIQGMGALETLDEAIYRHVINVNQVSVFLGMQAVVDSMRRAGGGAIINISSAAGLVGNPQAYPYTAAKFAVRGMTKCAAIELAPYKIRVNSIHPGLINTPMIAVTTANAETVARAISATPAGRIAEPDEVSSLVLLLASDEARFMTGSELVIDGGMTCQ